MDTLRFLSTLLLILLLFALSYDFYLAVKYVESDASKDISITENDAMSSNSNHHHNHKQNHKNNHKNNNENNHKNNQQHQSNSQTNTQ